MVGSKIPVLETEKLILTKSGRGLNTSDDGVVLRSGGAWYTRTADRNDIVSGGLYLMAASCSAWIKVTYASGTEYTGATGYIPVFPHHYNSD